MLPMPPMPREAVRRLRFHPLALGWTPISVTRVTCRLDIPPSSVIIKLCHLHELDAVAMMQYEACTNLCRFVKSGKTGLA